MNRLLEISHELAELGQHKTDLSLRLSNQRDDLQNHQFALIPVEGWEGKNAEERKINEQRAYAQDAACQAIQALVKTIEGELTGTEQLIQALVDERRALEWQIRMRLVEAIIGHVVTTNGNGAGRVEDTAFDDYADEVAATRLSAHFAEPYPPEDDPTVMTTYYDRAIADEADIPF